MPESTKFQRLDERLASYDSDVATVIRLVLFEEQRRLGLKSPKDIQGAIEQAIEAALAERGPSGGADRE